MKRCVGGGGLQLRCITHGLFERSQIRKVMSAFPQSAYYTKYMVPDKSAVRLPDPNGEPILHSRLGKALFVAFIFYSLNIVPKHCGVES